MGYRIESGSALFCCKRTSCKLTAVQRAVFDYIFTEFGAEHRNNLGIFNGFSGKDIRVYDCISLIGKHRCNGCFARSRLTRKADNGNADFKVDYPECRRAQKSVIDRKTNAVRNGATHESPFAAHRINLTQSIKNAVCLGFIVVFSAVFNIFFKVFSFTLKTNGADRIFLGKKEFFVFFKAALDYRNLSFRGIMLIFHAGGFCLFALFELGKNRGRNCNFAKNRLKLGGSYSAGSQKGWRVCCKGHNR